MTSATTHASEDVYVQMVHSAAAKSGAISPEEHWGDLPEVRDPEWDRALMNLTQAVASLLSGVLPTTDEFYTKVVVNENFSGDMPSLIGLPFLRSPARERDIFVQMEPQKARPVTMRIVRRKKEDPNPIFDLLRD